MAYIDRIDRLRQEAKRVNDQDYNVDKTVDAHSRIDHVGTALDVILDELKHLREYTQNIRMYGCGHCAGHESNAK